MNPLTIKGFEVEDKSAPVFRNLRLVGFDNDELARALGWDLLHAFRKSPRSTEYTLAVTLPGGLDDFWLSAEIVDKVGKSLANKPIYDLEVRCLDRVLYHLRYDQVSFDDTYLIDAQRNFTMAQSGNQEYYNLVDMQTVQKMSGICEMVGQDPPPVEIIATDAAGNSSRAIVRIFDAGHSSKDRKFAVPKPDSTRLNSLLDKYGRDYGTFRAAWIPGGRNLYLLVKAPSTKPAQVMVLHREAGWGKPLNQVIGKFYLGIVDRITDIESGGIILETDSVQVLFEPAAGEHLSFSVPVNYKRIRHRSGESMTLTSDDKRFTIEFPEGQRHVSP